MINKWIKQIKKHDDEVTEEEIILTIYLAIETMNKNIDKDEIQVMDNEELVKEICLNVEDIINNFEVKQND